MDPVTLIIDALTAGAIKGVGESAAEGVREAYAGLKHLLSSRFAGRPSAEVAIAEYEADPDTWRVPLVKELQVTGVADDQAVVEAAQRLMALLDESGARAGKYVVNVQGSQGVVIGDHSRVVQTFTAPPTSLLVTVSPPEEDAPGVDGAGELPDDKRRVKRTEIHVTGSPGTVIGDHVTVHQTFIGVPAAIRGPVFAIPPLDGREVNRPKLMASVIDFVSARGAGTVAMTTALREAGGFGKTTLARLLVHDPIVKTRFPDGIVWVTLGEDIAGSDLAGRVDDVCAVLTGTKPPIADPLLAGAELGRALGERHMLLVIDDVWSRPQLEPFLYGGPNIVRLLTTRNREVVPVDSKSVEIDAMAVSDARRLLLEGLSTIPPQLVNSVLEVTGCWPILLALVNGAARADVRAGRSAAESLADIRDALVMLGPAALDVSNPRERQEAVAATMAVSSAQLTPDQRQRYSELAIFGEDIEIPRAIVERYWQRTAGWSAFQAHRFCQLLASLSLIQGYHLDPPGPRLLLHDVIHRFLRTEVRERLPDFNRALLDSCRDLAPAEGGVTAWWRLPRTETYLWAWVAVHLANAGLSEELQACLDHPQFLVGKLETLGPAALDSDLGLLSDPANSALRNTIRQIAHLLGPLDPPGSLGATLAYHLRGNPVLADLLRRLDSTLKSPWLRPVGSHAGSDLPHPALTRTLTGHSGPVQALAVAPDGTWLASAGNDTTVRIWDPITGQPRATLTGHGGATTALVVAPDGTWLASAGNDTTVQIWDPITGQPRTRLIGHSAPVTALAVAPDSTWLATTGLDRTVRIWDLNSRRVRILEGHALPGRALTVAPDGSWLASAGNDATIRIYDPLSGRTLHTLTGHGGPVSGLAAAPDSSWLATASYDGSVRVWDLTAGEALQVFTGNNYYSGTLAAAADGTWLAFASRNDGVRSFNPVSGRALGNLRGHSDSVRALAGAPDGTWLASASQDATVRIWDPIDGRALGNLTGHSGPVRALAGAPDGSWLASASDDGTIRTWDLHASTAEQRRSGRPIRVGNMAAAPNGAWVATAYGFGLSSHGDTDVQIWNTTTAAIHHTLRGHIDTVRAVAAAPDGTWVASTGDDQTILIWDPVSGAKRCAIRTRRSHRAMSMVAAPDGSWLVTGGFNGTVRIWATDGSLRGALTSRRGVMWETAISPDGTWFATAGRGRNVWIWDPSAGALRYALAGHTDDVRALVIATDGSWLASGSDDRSVRLWDPATGRLRHVLSGHTGRVTALATASDGDWLASGSGDRSVRLWDPATGQLRHVLSGHTGRVTALATAPNGDGLASVSQDGSLRIWNPVSGACAAAIRIDSWLNTLAWIKESVLVTGGPRGLYQFAVS